MRKTARIVRAATIGGGVFIALVVLVTPGSSDVRAGTGDAAQAPPRLLPAQPDTGAVMPPFVRQVVTGAPADSVVLRVSLCTVAGDGRFDTQAFLLIEELRWPLPRPPYRIVIEGVTDPPDPADEVTEEDWLLRVSRIDGGALNAARRELPPPPPRPGVRAGEIGGHLLRPFEFVAWLGPHRFIVDDGRASFVIARVGPGEYRLDEVVRR
jgi:hypothetical protein